MDVPTMYYVGLISNIVFLLLSIFGYVHILRKSGKKFLFIIWFTAAWLFSAISYILLISGASADEGYITALRIIGYVFFLATIVSLIIELSKLRKVV